MIQLDLKGKTILLTGASDGIGKAVATFLMKMEARVAVHYHRNKASAEALVKIYPKTRSKTFKANLAKEKEVYRLFKAVTDYFGKIDGIILNAGVFLSHSGNEKTEDWYEVWKKNDGHQSKLSRIAHQTRY